MVKKRSWVFICLTAVSFLVLIIYSNTLTSPFVFDDLENIVKIAPVRINALTVDNLIHAALERPNKHRPLTNISFAVNYYFNGFHVAGYHFINILIHIATGILLFFLFKQTLLLFFLKYRSHQISNPDNLELKSNTISFWAVLLWISHPIQTEAVTYIVQRATCMAAMFYVASLLLFVYGRLSTQKMTWVLFVFSFMAGCLACASKETAATLPFVVFLYHVLFLKDKNESTKKKVVVVLCALIVFLCISYAYIGFNPGDAIASSYIGREFTLGQRILTEFRVVVFYISLLLFPDPSRLNLNHDFPLSLSLMTPLTTIFSIAAISGLILLSVYLLRKNALISFCILWFFGNMVIESSVIGLELVFEHRNYLPSMFVSLAVVFFIFKWIRSNPLRLMLLFSLLLMLSVWTYQRNSIWQNEAALWEDCVIKSPHLSRPRNNLGIALVKQKRYREAYLHFREAIRIKSDYFEAYNNLGNLLENQGLNDKAEYCYRESLRIKGNYAQAHYNLARLFEKKGQDEKAIMHYEKAVKINPAYIIAFNNLGVLYEKRGDFKTAMSYYNRALKLNPDNRIIRHNLNNLIIHLNGQSVGEHPPVFEEKNSERHQKQ